MKNMGKDFSRPESNDPRVELANLSAYSRDRIYGDMSRA
jgi:hypothetical protein